MNGDKALATLVATSPTVNLCLEELTVELKELCEWACGAQWWHEPMSEEGLFDPIRLGKYGLHPQQFLAIALKLRNPTRAKTALLSARALATNEIEHCVESRNVVSPWHHSPPRSVTAENLLPSPPGPGSRRSLDVAEAVVVGERLADGAIYSGGSRLPLL